MNAFLAVAPVSAVAAPSVALQIYNSMVEVPARPQAQLGDSRFSSYPPRRRDIPGMRVSPLITVGQFRPYVQWAHRAEMTSGRVAYDPVTEQHVLLARGNNNQMSGVQVRANDPVANTNLDYSGADAVKIAPAPTWLDKLAEEHPVYGRDETPVVLVSPADIFAFTYWLNDQLMEERQAGRIPAGALFMAPHADWLESLMRSPEGRNEFGTHDGQAPNRRQRATSIEQALREDRGVPWGEHTIMGLCGVLWQWAINKHPNSRYVQAGGGSWHIGVQDLFHAAYRDGDFLGGRISDSGFRLVLPRAP